MPAELSPPTLDDRPGLPLVEGPPDPGAQPRQSIPVGDRLQFTRQTRVPFLERYFSENTSASAPLDITTGLPSWDRFQLGLKRTEAEQISYLEGKYGKDSARRATDGQWIVRAQGENGKPVDLVADPLGVDSGDWAELSASSPEVAGNIAGMVVTRGFGSFGKAKGILGAARDIVSGAIGGQTAGAIKDIAVRVGAGDPVNPREIAGSRAVMAAQDVLIGTAIGTGLAAVRFRKNPWFHTRTDVHVDAIRAQREVADKYGIHVELTPAELTGSRIMTIEQARLAKVPGGTGVLRRFKEGQAEALELLQEVMLGGRVPEADIVGRQAIRALQATTGATDAAVDAARLNLSRTGLEELEGIAATQTLAERNLGQIFTGDAIRNRVTALRDGAKAMSASLYARVKSLGGDQPIFDGTSLATRVKALRSDMPPVFDPAGTPGPLRTTAGAIVPSKEFVPASIRGMMDELEAGAGQNWRLTDLQQMRRRVYDDIAKGEALPGYDSHYLGKIASALTEAIEEGVEKLPTSDLKQALQAANNHYRERVVPFNKKGIAEMFAEDSERGYVGSAHLADQYTSGPGAADRWRVLKEFIGADSLEGRAIKRMAFDKVIGDSVDSASGLLNGKRLTDALASFKSSSPDFYAEVFGKAGDDLQRVAKFVIAGEKDVLPAAQVEEMLRTGKGVTVTALRALKEAEEKASALYRNQIMEGVRAGKFDASKIRADEFTDRFLDKASKDEIAEVMGHLQSRPALLDDIRASAMTKLLNRHAGKDPIMAAIKEAERDPAMRTLFGKEMFDDLRNYAALDKAILTTREASVAGSLEATTVVNMLLRVPLWFMQRVIGNQISSRIITSSTLRNWALRQPESSHAVTLLMLSSPEFLRGVKDSFGDDAEGMRQAETFLGAARRALSEGWAQEQGRPLPRQAGPAPELSPPTLVP